MKRKSVAIEVMGMGLVTIMMKLQTKNDININRKFSAAPNDLHSGLDFTVDHNLLVFFNFQELPHLASLTSCTFLRLASSPFVFPSYWVSYPSQCTFTTWFMMVWTPCHWNLGCLCTQCSSPSWYGELCHLSSKRSYCFLWFCLPIRGTARQHLCCPS